MILQLSVLCCRKLSAGSNIRYVIRVSAPPGLRTWRKFCMRFSQAKIFTDPLDRRGGRVNATVITAKNDTLSPPYVVMIDIQPSLPSYHSSMPRGHSFPSGVIPLPTSDPEIKLNTFRRLRIGSGFKLQTGPTWRDVPFSFPSWQVGLTGILI